MPNFNVFQRIFFLTVFSISVLGCSKDVNQTANDKLNGSWEVNSWLVNEVDFMDTDFNSFELVFTKTSDYTGKAFWNFEDTMDDPINLEGTYNILDSGTSVIFNGVYSTERKFNFSFEGNVLVLDGSFTSENWTIEATKK